MPVIAGAPDLPGRQTRDSGGFIPMCGRNFFHRGRYTRAGFIVSGNSVLSRKTGNCVQKWNGLKNFFLIFRHFLSQVRRRKVTECNNRHRTVTLRRSPTAGARLAG